MRIRRNLDLEVPGQEGEELEDAVVQALEVLGGLLRVHGPVHHEERQRESDHDHEGQDEEHDHVVYHVPDEQHEPAGPPERLEEVPHLQGHAQLQRFDGREATLT